MLLSPMRYKDYTWPHNPRVYTIDYRRTMAVQKVPFGGYLLQDLGQEHRVMEGEGEFAGEGAYREFQKLASVFYDRGPGLLVHPLWQAANTYFVSLRLEQEPRPDYIRYSFAFWEDMSYYSDEARPLQGQPAASAAGTGVSPQFYKVLKGDTLWGIANKYALSLQTLIGLNPDLKNPNQIQVGDEVRIR